MSPESKGWEKTCLMSTTKDLKKKKDSNQDLALKPGDKEIIKSVNSKIKQNKNR